MSVLLERQGVINTAKILLEVITVDVDQDSLRQDQTCVKVWMFNKIKMPTVSGGGRWG